MVMLGNGLLDDTSGGPTNAGKQLQLQAQLCAALNRRVARYAADPAARARFAADPGLHHAGAPALDAEPLVESEARAALSQRR